MFKVKKNNLIYFAVVFSLLTVLLTLIPIFRPLILNLFRLPFTLSSFLAREAQGIVLYHKNMAQNEISRKENDLLRYKLNAMDELLIENGRLKNLLTLKQNVPYKVIAAGVLGRLPDNWSSGIIIDKGSLAGVRRGFIVVSYLGLVGRIIETSQYSSKIILINDPSLSVSAIIQRSRQEGLVSGTLGGTLIMKYLPKDADVKVDDTIITSGLTQIYPKGILIGTVVDVGEEFSGLSRYAIIKPSVSLTSIEEVLIIIP